MARLSLNNLSTRRTQGVMQLSGRNLIIINNSNGGQRGEAASTPPSPPPPPTTIDESRYELGKVLGQGGCGIVYEAVDRHMSRRRVALKVLPAGVTNPVTLARLAREARTASTINHPNVCGTLDRGLLEDGRPYVAMELLEGETLRAYMTRRERLSEEEAIEIAVQMLAGLDAAHALGVVHRDIKPENVFIVQQPNGRVLVKLMDFGICRRAAHPLDQQTLTVAGSVVGTPGYLSPEQVYGDRTIDPRADLFAVGLVLFEMLAGRAAIRGNNPLELAAAATARVPSLRTFVAVSTLIDRIVAHATEHDPDLRYPSAARFQHDLLEARTALRRARGYRRHSSSSSAAVSTAPTPPPMPTPAPTTSPKSGSTFAEEDEAYWDATTRRMTGSSYRRRQVA
jgi:eukaryotic-like serine/threonine-protein kinase